MIKRDCISWNICSKFPNKVNCGDCAFYEKKFYSKEDQQADKGDYEYHQSIEEELLNEK